MNVLDGPSLFDRIAFIAGQKLVKCGGAPRPSYSLSGVLYLDKSGWLLLSVPNALVRGLFADMDEHGIELPLARDGGSFSANIGVMSPEEVEQIGEDKLTERGKRFAYTIGRLMEMEPEDWPGVNKVWYLTIHSSELQTLRRSYGLSSLPSDGDHDFHVTCAVRRRGVLGRNETRKGQEA